MVAVKCGYQNVGRGSAAALTFLNYTAEERWYICWVAEPCITSSPTGWGTQNQSGYRKLLPTTLTGRYSHGVAMYVREGGPLTKATPIGDGIHWAGIHTGSSAYVGVYLSPSLPAPEYRAIIGQLKEAMQAYRHITIMGDFNCLHEMWVAPELTEDNEEEEASHATRERRIIRDRPRSQAVIQLAEDLQLDLQTPPGIPTRQALRHITQSDGSRRQIIQESTIDLIWSTGTWIPAQRELVSLSDHITLAGTITTADIIPLVRTRETTALDWPKVEKWIKVQLGEQEDDEIKVEPPPASGMEAYNRLRELVSGDWSRPVRFHPRSKPYWDQELSTARDDVIKAPRLQKQAARKRFRNLLQQKRRQHWEEYLQEYGAKDPWAAVRTARDPFKLRSSMPQVLKDANGTILRTDEEKCTAITRHNFQPPCTEPTIHELEEEPIHEGSLSIHLPPQEVLREQVDQALAKTSNSSAPGPDLISWRLLKAVSATVIGNAILDLVVTSLQTGQLPQEWREMRTVMIPKPGKDHTKVGGWRPIVLANTCGKLWDKVIAD